MEKPVDLDLDAPAGEVFAAAMVTPRAAGRWAALRLSASAMFQAVLNTGEPATTTVSGHLVVTRRDTGETVLRTESDTTDAALLEYVQHQLEELTAGEFLERWGIGESAQ
jgi:hypothetical protein